MATTGVNTGSDVKMSEGEDLKKGPIGDIEFQVSQVIGRLEEAVIGKGYSSQDNSALSQSSLTTDENSDVARPKSVLQQLEELLLVSSEPGSGDERDVYSSGNSPVMLVQLPELCEAGRLSLVSHALAAYSGALERNHVLCLSSRIADCVDSHLTQLFRCPDYKVCYHEELLAGTVRVVRALLNTTVAGFSEGGYEALGSRLPVIYTSITSPALLGFVCSQLGLPLRCVTQIPCNTLFGSQRMDLAALGREIEADRAADRLPLIVLADAGARVSGQVDNLSRLSEICRSSGVWLHLTGHSLAALTLSQLTAAPSSTGGGGPLADSMTLPLGIWLGIPGLPTATVYNQAALVPSAAGLLESPGRKLISLPLWTTFQCLGIEEIRRRFQRAFEWCQQLWQRLQKFNNIRILSQTPGGEGGLISISELATKPVNANILFEVAASTVVLQFVPEGHQGRVPPYYDKLNSWLGQILSRDCPGLSLSLCELESGEVVLRYCPLEPQPGHSQPPDFDAFILCLEQQIEILTATVRHKSEFTRLVESSDCLELVEMEGWAGLGGVRYQPARYRGLDLSPEDRAQLNQLNSSLVERLRATDAAFSVGEGSDGMACVRFGMVTADTEVGELLALVEAAGQEEEETGRALDSMAELVKRGIEAATLELQRESEEQLWQEGILRSVPVVGSLVNWWSPPAGAQGGAGGGAVGRGSGGTSGRSLDLTAGIVLSTENIYRYHRQSPALSQTTPPLAQTSLAPPAAPPLTQVSSSSAQSHSRNSSSSSTLLQQPPPQQP